MEIEQLAKNFTLKGFRYTQVKRENDYAIYLQENDVPINSKDYYCYYEVIKIRKQKALQTLIQGKSVLYPAKEVYPNIKNWGVTGWTFKSFTNAEAHFLKLTKKVPCSSQSIAKKGNLDSSSKTLTLFV